MRPRVLVYTSVLLALSVGLLSNLYLRTPFKVDVIRDRGTANQTGGELIENTYRLQIMNATEHAQSYSIGARGMPGLQMTSPQTVTVASASARWVPVRLQIPATGTSVGAHVIEFSISPQGLDSEQIHEKSIFLVPK